MSGVGCTDRLIKTKTEKYHHHHHHPRAHFLLLFTMHGERYPSRGKNIVAFGLVLFTGFTFSWPYLLKYRQVSVFPSVLGKYTRTCTHAHVHREDSQTRTSMDTYTPSAYKQTDKLVMRDTHTDAHDRISARVYTHFNHIYPV